MIKYITFLILPLDSNVNAALISLQSLDINKYFDYSDSFKRIGIQKMGTNAPKTLKVDTFENIRTEVIQVW